jgi:ketosteroid isomerase-like protein
MSTERPLPRSRPDPNFHADNMPTMEQTAKAFFEAVEAGKGWAVCQDYCTPDATFSSQTDVLAEVKTPQAYADWMQGPLIPIPDGDDRILAWGVDQEREAVVAAAVFTGTRTGAGGPVPPTGKRFEADYTYVMQFAGGKIRHMTKIWNDLHSLRQVGWA